MDIKQVYNNIAIDFDRTRYKIWPVIKRFLDSLNSNTLVGDIGCGNGKNMMIDRRDIKFKGIDLSDEFVKICTSKGLDVINGNILNIPFDDDYFDNCISIAVIHHLKEKNDRIKAIREILRITKHNGTILIYVWAFEQPSDGKIKFNSTDEMVPYTTITGQTYYRYYHLYNKDELINELKEITQYKYEIIENGYERGNWYIIIKKI
jgi:SAM-dependent methyltransferase